MTRLIRWISFGLAAVFIGWIGWTSPTLHECLYQKYADYSGQTFQEDVSGFYVFLVGSRICIGDFIHTNGEGIIAIFTVILGIATWFLWKATRDLVNDSKATGASQIDIAFIAATAAKSTADNLASTERARMFIVVCENSLQPNTEFYCSGEPDGMNQFGRWYVAYTFKNYGKTPAIIRETSHALINSASLPYKPSYEPLDIVEREFAISYEASMINRWCNLTTIKKIGQQEAIDIFQGRTTLWFYGRVIYDDVLGGQGHEHRFLWHYNGLSKGFRPCYDYPEYTKNT